MGVLYEGKLDDLIFSGVPEDNKNLLDIYTERTRFFNALMEQGYDFKKAQTLAELRYQADIDKICYPKGKKEVRRDRGGDIYNIYKLLDKIRPTINGEAIYMRLLIQCVGQREYIGDGLSELCIDPAEVNNYINNKNAFIELLIEEGGDIKIKKIKIAHQCQERI